MQFPLHHMNHRIISFLEAIQTKFALACALFFGFTTLQAQPWVEGLDLNDPNVTFYQVQQNFDQYWANRPVERGKGWKAYKRWEEFMAPRVYPTGRFFNPNRAYQEYNTWLQQNGQGMNTQATANWQLMGPTQVPGNGGGAGRLSAIAFMPGNTQTIFVGAPAGGLWKSTNYGATWTPMTDQLPTLGVSDIVIDPNNTNTIYIATGDRDAGDTYAVGVMKSTDGGITWNNTGMNWNITQARTVNRLIMHPANSQILIAACSNGIWRTTNGGTTWTQTQTSGDHKDMEMNPNNADTIYAASSNVIRRSVNNGVTWTTMATVSGVNRIEFAVSPANSSYVYALCSKSSDNGFHSLRRSTDRGATWTVMSTSPNIFGWNTTGSDSGGQGWYDISLAVSPTNANWIIAGGVNQWHSTNGGTNWTMNAHWYGGGGKPYVHADIHVLHFEPGSSSIIYSMNDGGIFRTTNTGTTWTDLSSGLSIAMMYGISNNPAVSTTVWAGHQDNGTNRLQTGTWSQRIGGDGMWCLNSHTNTNTVYGSLYYGDIRRSTNGGTSFTQIAGNGVNGITEDGGWVTPYIQDPNNASILYAGYNRVWKTTDGGNAWTVAYAIPGTSKVVAMDMSANNANVVYSAKSNKMYRNTTDITAGLPVSSASITYIRVDPANEDRVWVTFSGFSAANKIFRTTDGGSTWTNITYNLPNLPANCVEYIPGTTEELYIGTDVGVYTFDPATNTWTQFNTGLPNVIVRDLKLHAGANKLRAGTYGRGLWETDLNTTPQPPVADFLASSTSICVGNTIGFTDLTTNQPTSWSWSFPGGTPASSTTQNPSVTYSTPGTYDVTLTATNGQGSDVETKLQYIVVGSSGGSLPLIEDFESGVFSTNGWSLSNPDNATTWDIVTTSGNTSGSNSARMNIWNYATVGERDGMISKALDFTQYNSVNLAFKHAYRRSGTTDTDSLLIYVSTDCGATFSNIVYQRGSQPMATNVITNTDYSPASVSDWCLNGTYDTCYQNIDLSAFLAYSAVMVKFETYNSYGGNIFVDDINITGVVNTPPPVADFTANNTIICPGQQINFSDLSTNSPSTWVWSFTGGTPASSSSQNPAVTYNAPGTYAVSLTVTNPGGNDTKNVNGFIIVGGGTTASITPPTNTAICGSGSVTLTSANTATSYQWLLNGSPISGAISSSYTATAAGTYDLVAITGTCSDTSNTSVVITVTPATPAVVNIQNGITTICGTQGAVLLGSGGGTYQWLINGTPIPGATNSTYAANQAGSYDLVVDNAGCLDTTNSSTSIVQGTQPTANFSHTVLNNQVTFTDGSANATTWFWDFGDGNTSNVQNPGSNTYANTGTYVVTQIVTNGGCSDTVVYQVIITTLSANGLMSEDALEIYPNPSQGVFNIRLGDEGGRTVQLSILDVNGKEVFLKNLQDNATHAIDITSLSKGNYVLRLTHEKGRSERKIVRN